MSKRAVIYARVSTDLQRENYSIPTQVQECQKYARSMGYVVVGNQFVDPQTGRDVLPGNGGVPAYVDDFTSRELSRPSLDGMIGFLETTGFDVVIIYSIDRLARDPYNRQTLEREFEARGASTEYVLGNYSETPEGEIRKDLDATFAKWENATRVERCNRGKKRKAESGKFVTGRVTFGYIIDKDAPGGLRIDEERATIVRQIFSMFAEENLSMREIAARLNREGIPAHQGGQWRQAALAGMLTNPTYVGYFYYNKHKRAGRSHKDRPRDEWIRIECEPIVDQSLFDLAQPQLEHNRDLRRRRPTRFYLLSGMVSCLECNRAYSAELQTDWEGRKVKKYRHRKNLGHCKNRSITEQRLGSIVWEKVLKVIQEPAELRVGYDAARNDQAENHKRLLAHLETLAARKENLEQQKQKLTNAYLDPDIGMTKHEYIEQKSRIEAELNDIKAEFDKAKEMVVDLPTEAEFEALTDFAEKVREHLKDNINPSDEEKRALFELLHIKVKIGVNDLIKIEGWFGEKSGNGGKTSTTSRCN